jgi:hypothetical protein
MSWRHGVAATIAAGAAFVGLSGSLLDERLAVTCLGFGVLLALSLGGRMRPLSR